MGANQYEVGLVNPTYCLDCHENLRFSRNDKPLYPRNYDMFTPSPKGEGWGEGSVFLNSQWIATKTCGFLAMTVFLVVSHPVIASEAKKSGGIVTSRLTKDGLPRLFESGNDEK